MNLIHGRGIPAIIVLLIIMTAIVPGGATSEEIGGVPVGEPLHLWFKRSPTQDMTTLVFYPPKDNDTVRSDPRFRHVFGPRWNETSSYTLFFPTARESNFLQFEYNGTLKGNYTFFLSAVTPKNASGIEFRLKITIDMDIRNEQDGRYDESFTFTVEGLADSERRVYTGEIDIPAETITRFDGEKGGRLRVTLERDDDIDTDVILYCGYAGLFSSFNLPFSKYRYEPSGNDGEGEFPVMWVLILGSLFILVVVFVVDFLNGRGEKEAEKPERGRKGRRKR